MTGPYIIGRAMRVLVLGASGLVGEELMRQFSIGHDAVGTYCTSYVEPLLPLDITDSLSVNRLVAEYKPHWIMLPAARTNLDWCEEHPEECIRVNLEGTVNVIEAAVSHKARLTFFSSDAVFDGWAGPYGEDDQIRPISLYGRMKAEAERQIQRRLPGLYLILRTTWVYGWERRGKNFITTLMRCAAEGKRLSVAVDQISCPTYAPDLAKAAKALVESGATGVFHVAGPERMDRVTFARLAFKIFHLDTDVVVPRLTSGLGQRAKRPLNSGLTIDKLMRTVNIVMRSPGRALLEMGKDFPEASDLANTPPVAARGNQKTPEMLDFSAP